MRMMFMMICLLIVQSGRSQIDSSGFVQLINEFVTDAYQKEGSFQQQIDFCSSEKGTPILSTTMTFSRFHDLLYVYDGEKELFVGDDYCIQLFEKEERVHFTRSDMRQLLAYQMNGLLQLLGEETDEFSIEFNSPDVLVGRFQSSGFAPFQYIDWKWDKRTQRISQLTMKLNAPYPYEGKEIAFLNYKFERSSFAKGQTPDFVDKMNHLFQVEKDSFTIVSNEIKHYQTILE